MDSEQALQLRVDPLPGGAEESGGTNSGVAGKRRYELRRSGKAELVFQFQSSLYFVSHRVSGSGAGHSLGGHGLP
ncbi:hypothetical protein PAXRUDRAFT_21020 [Paxillus rubicundulus Ve08.2h10]|uniref:Uncharacterized protein n=1 Tax=Paxillus rubicundulus Ve08.2h10 TaxID=930991 RepID=A0A0D0CR45_9AGAM|nr:hypothetical protein PAXRUDRAFT_21020 [Paxillus rubicundulus Ve08.2h10]